MKTWRRLAVAASAATLAIATLPSPTWAKAPPRPSQPTPPAAGANGVTQLVESWALAPAGSATPDKPGNRPTLSYEVAPGTEVKDAVILFNYSNVQLTFRLYATDAFNNADGSFDLMPGDKKPKDAGSWVTLPQDNITVPAASQATLPISVKVPADARPGDHAGAVLASNAAQGSGADGKIVTLDRRTGSRMYIRVAGPLIPELAVEKVHTTYHPSLNPLGGSADVTYRIQNRGNVRLGVKQSVSVGGPFGLLTKRQHPKELPELLPGDGVTMKVTFNGVASSALAFTGISAIPVPVGGGAGKVASAHRGAITLAVPFSLLALAAVVWLLLLARRSALRHRRDSHVVGVPAR